MRGFLCGGVAIPSSLPSCCSVRIPRSSFIHRSSRLGVCPGHDWCAVSTRRSFRGSRISSYLRNPERRRSRIPSGNLPKCLWWSSSLPSRDRARTTCLPSVSSVCRKPAEERIVVASLRRALACNACEGCMDGRLATGNRFGSSSLMIGCRKINPASAFSEIIGAQSHPASSGGVRVPRYGSHSLIQSAFKKNLRSEYSVEAGTRPLIRVVGADISKRIKLRESSGSHIEKRKVTVFSKPKPWWKQVLFQQLNEEDSESDPEDSEEENGEGNFEEEDGEFMEDVSLGMEGSDEDDVDRMLSDDRRYFSWLQKRNATEELREYQETGRDPDSRDWEDWLDEGWSDYNENLSSQAGGWYTEQSEWEKGGFPRQPPKKPERGMSRSIKELFLRIFETQEEVEDDLNFEEKIFRFTSQTTARFVTILILVPWGVDFLVHDFVLVPFLRRWVEEVPLAAKLLDVKESQKLHMVERLKLERQRVRFEAEIGKAPALADDELNDHIREEALELREELREENRQAFANIWSDALAGFTIFLLLVFNPQQVVIMQMTGDRLFTNISDTGKAFIIILCTDIFLGYHSESGWETVIEIVLDHFGLEVSMASIYTFVAIVPVTIDACFKLWVFRYLSKLSPSAAATFREMKRH